MATVIDTLFLELGIDSGKFGTQAKEAESRLDRISASFGRAEKSAAKSSKGLEKQAVQSAKSTKQAKSLTQAVGSLAKGFAAFTALVMGSNALDKMIREGAQANVELDNLSRNIGISRNQLQAWGGMAEMAGGSAEGMKGGRAEYGHHPPHHYGRHVHGSVFQRFRRGLAQCRRQSTRP